jgi:hypothetical protein
MADERQAAKIYTWSLDIKVTPQMGVQLSSNERRFRGDKGVPLKGYDLLPKGRYGCK